MIALKNTLFFFSLPVWLARLFSEDVDRFLRNLGMLFIDVIITILFVHEKDTYQVKCNMRAWSECLRKPS